MHNLDDSKKQLNQMMQVIRTENNATVINQSQQLIQAAG